MKRLITAVMFFAFALSTPLSEATAYKPGCLEISLRMIRFVSAELVELPNRQLFSEQELRSLPELEFLDSYINKFYVDVSTWNRWTFSEKRSWGYFFLSWYNCNSYLTTDVIEIHSKSGRKLAEYRSHSGLHVRRY